jgi:hypothetical protein
MHPSLYEDAMSPAIIPSISYLSIIFYSHMLIRESDSRHGQAHAARAFSNPMARNRQA